MEFIQLTKTTVDWNAYMSFCKKCINEVPIKSLDSSPIKFNEDLAFITSLSELANKDLTPINAIRSQEIFRSCIYISYLTFKLLSNNYGNLRKIELSNQFIYIYGSLRDWKDTIVLNLTEHATKEEREFYSAILLDLEFKGYTLIFDTHRKVLKDGYIILEEK